jgi:hypothetical protein
MTVTGAQQDRGVPGAAEVDPDAAIDLRDGLTALGEPKGVVYTKPWVVDLILDLAGYRVEIDLADLYAVEPSAGEGAFLIPMVRRLLASIRHHGRSLADARSALHAYELDEAALISRVIPKGSLRAVAVSLLVAHARQLEDQMPTLPEENTAAA